MGAVGSVKFAPGPNPVPAGAGRAGRDGGEAGAPAAGACAERAAGLRPGTPASRPRKGSPGAGALSVDETGERVNNFRAVGPLSKRERAILCAVVTEFTATGEPVGSRTLARKYELELSPASIRNVLADLEEAGYLAQPHASAGRVPTEAAFRLFIDGLMRLRQLSDDETAKISTWFGALRMGADMLRGTGRLLSDMTGVAAVLFRTRLPSRTLAKLRFIRTRPGELLGVLVLSDGTVENRFVQVEPWPSEQELERLHNMLEEVVDGRTLEALRDHFARSVDQYRGELSTLRQMGASLLNAAIDAAEQVAEIIIEGRARLIERPEFTDADRLRELVRALEEREQLVTLLDRIIETSRVQVFLGAETRDKVGFPMSLIAAPYLEDGRPSGAIGVIGPTPMDYPSVVPLVRATADAMTVALSRAADEAAAPPVKGR